jgi:membrane-associated phospholipid phosphatase
MKNRIIPLLLLASFTGVFGNPSCTYKLKSSDAWFIGGGLVLAGTGEWLSCRVSPPDPETLDRSEIFLPDQIALRYKSSTAARMSDFTASFLALAPFAITLSENSRSKDWTESALYMESQLWTIGLTELCKGVFQRPRPYVYRDSAGSPDKEGARSFFSGHTSVAFAGAVSAAIFWDHFHPDSRWSRAVRISSLSLAATTGVLRVLAGKHFPTDVLTGAAVGALIGWAVPRMHREDTVPEKRTSSQPMLLNIQLAF